MGQLTHRAVTIYQNGSLSVALLNQSRFTSYFVQYQFPCALRSHNFYLALLNQVCCVLPSGRFGPFMSSPTDGGITEERAIEILLATQVAWNARNLRALKDLYTEDITYWTNWGGPNNEPRTVSGRQEFIRHLADLRDTTDITIRLVSLRLEGNQARAHFEVKWSDPKTSLVHHFTCRNIITFDGERIQRIEEYQDAARLDAFAKLIREQGG